MNASSVNAIQAVWLDPFSPLADTDRAQLDAAGISLQTVSTLGDLHVALRRAHVLIIRLGDNAELLGEVQTLIGQLGYRMPVICRVERRRMEVAVDAMRLGALHVLPADEWNTGLWADAVAALNVKAQAPKSFVFVDPVSQQLLALAQRVAQTEVTALLVGPTGAGKEVLARVLHEASPRAKGPFVALNCAALPEHLIEDMLFGHEKGAFTGAHKEHKGLFEQAHGGTVFLDEIGEMPIHLQAKLLRVLQEKKLNRLGGEATIDLDVRLIAATNKDLRAAIDAREFREDLYFRISTFRLRIQPLRERIGDKGTVYVWSSFEAVTLAKILEQLALPPETFGTNEITSSREDLAAWIEKLLGPKDDEGKRTNSPRIRDLHKLAERHYFHPDMLGRTSIKVVLPAIWKNQDHIRNHPWFADYQIEKGNPGWDDPYKALPTLPIGTHENETEKDLVSDGTGAIRVYQQLLFAADLKESLRMNHEKLLLQYCKLDTAAMVMIWRHWVGGLKKANS